jgi:phage shock protein PspC (stress-responsive transcriptional regulator)
MANPGEDFEGYMEAMAAEEAHQQADEQMYASHQLWREKTWQGKIVGVIHGIGQHFRPFIEAVAEALQEEKGAGFRALQHFLRVVIVVVGIVSLYIIANLIQTMIGKEIVIEQEVVIIEKVRQSDLDGEREKRDESVTIESKKRSKPRSSRDKKTQ